jgi:L-iditol 2-dehydrogenase
MGFAANEWSRRRVTIEAAGAPDAVAQAMRYTRDAGRVVVVGQYTDHGETSFNPHLDLNRKHLDVRGVGVPIFRTFIGACNWFQTRFRSASWGKLKTKLSRYGSLRRTRHWRMLRQARDESID